MVIERLIDGSDRIVAVGRTYGTVRSSGRIFELEGEMGFEPAACWEAGTLTTSTMQLRATKVRAASAEEISSLAIVTALAP